MNTPLISVIMPVYNNAKTLALAIDSIRNQTYENLEIIIVNDGSTDNTEEIATLSMRKDPRITYYKVDTENSKRIDLVLNRNINAGYAARNFGFKKAHGEFITFQDGDDASLLNRIEVQYGLLNKYAAMHVTIGWIPFTENLIGTHGAEQMKGVAIGPEELYRLSQKTKGLVAKIALSLNAAIPFHWKRLPLLNKLFFGSLESYPGSGNCPLFTRKVIEKIQFRELQYRVWPSFMGRGADRDFNFQVAETFKKSYVFPIPLYLWSIPGHLSTTPSPDIV
jgi:glycosyltransferase involved in cell wall biosynthesis